MRKLAGRTRAHPSDLERKKFPLREELSENSLYKQNFKICYIIFEGMK